MPDGLGSVFLHSCALVIPKTIINSGEAQVSVFFPELSGALVQFDGPRQVSKLFSPRSY